MKWRGLLESIPELADMPKPARARLWRRVYPQAFGKPRTWLILLLCTLSFPTALIAAQVAAGYSGFRDQRSIAIAIGLLAMIGNLAISLVFAHHLVRTVRAEMIRQATTCCWNCWYDLTGNTSGICPKCGTPRQNTRSASKTLSVSS